MSQPISLAEKRWDTGDGRPQSHSCREMLEVAIAKLDSGEIKADHMVVCYGHIADGQGNDGYLQAGSFDGYGQIGLIARIKRLMEEGDIS